MSTGKMSERKFTRGLGKPGMAAQLRETVSQVVRESTVQVGPLTSPARHFLPLDRVRQLFHSASNNKYALTIDINRSLLSLGPSPYWSIHWAVNSLFITITDNHMQAAPRIV